MSCWGKNLFELSERQLEFHRDEHFRAARVATSLAEQTQHLKQWMELRVPTALKNQLQDVQELENLKKESAQRRREREGGSGGNKERE